jgi:hypothetical protein
VGWDAVALQPLVTLTEKVDGITVGGINHVLLKLVESELGLGKLLQLAG